MPPALQRQVSLTRDEFNRATNMFDDMDRNHDGVVDMVEFQALMETIARRTGKTPAQVSLNWIICKGAIPIPGASSVAQVQENAGALGWRLSPEDIALLDAAADALPFEFRGSGFQTADSKFVGYGFERWRLD